MNIHGYKLSEELKNANSGFSKWGFAEKYGKEFFIKELITPVYPVDFSSMPPELFEQSRQMCHEFEQRSARFYSAINYVSKGNLVRINEFFRCGSKYYLITDKIEGETVGISEIASLSPTQKLMLLKSTAQAFKDLHSAGIVHADIKPSNILIKKTRNNNYAAKVIDFDAGYFINDVPSRDEIGGDLTYLAPETFLAIYGENIVPDEKSDIFGLALVFHQYFCGELPCYDKSKYDYPYEAVLDGAKLQLREDLLPEALQKMLVSMLESDPKNRPSARSIVDDLNVLLGKNGELGNTLGKELRSLEIYFSDSCERAIRLSPKSLQYKNLKAPVEVPDEFFNIKKILLTPDQFKAICTELTNAGLFDILSSEETNPLAYSRILCACTDETLLTYSVSTAPHPTFERIVKTLCAYCPFEEIKAPEMNTPVNEPVNTSQSSPFKIAGNL